MKKRGLCLIHPSSEDWLYVPKAGAKLCVQCLRDGLYRLDVTTEAELMYPRFFAKSSEKENKGVKS